MRLNTWFKSLLMTIAVVAGSAAFSGTVLAHSVLNSSMPGDTAVVSAPEKLELTFNEAVRVLRLTLVHGAAHQIEFGFAPSTEPTQTLSYDLPMMMMGAHTVSWTVIGSDGHTVSGSFGFTVSAEGAPAQQMMHSHGTPAETPHHH